MSESDPIDALDTELMDHAVGLGQKGDPSPNPHVGAVVALGREIIAEGHHNEAGDDHAEVVAIKVAAERAKGATLYVTLEPCNHEGRTGPCVDFILQAGLKRVVVGCRDPNPHVKGGGVERLREAGVEVVVGVCEEKASPTSR